MKKLLFISFIVLVPYLLHGQASGFSGMSTGMSDLFKLSNARTRSINPENFTGEKGKAGMATLETGSAAGAARELGVGWKVSPYVVIKPKSTFTLAEMDGPGAIQQIWMTPAGNTRFAILRFYWDDEKIPSIEVPVGDFFAAGWGQFKQISSLAVCVNPGSGYNCYWVMPFRKKCRITLENLADDNFTLYYQINYTLTEIPDDAGYFHAQFRRVNPLPYKEVYTILDGVKGKGQYVGTYLAWGTHNAGWWGEGEIKFYLDGDKEYPTICGTGTEDYFCGSYGFEVKGSYQDFSSPYTGFHSFPPDAFMNSQMRFGMYRWHITDPVRFDKDLKVTIHDLGWMSGGRYLPLQDDIASVAFWYQSEPHNAFPKLPDRDALELK
jgi:hypothetical protein